MAHMTSDTSGLPLLIDCGTCVRRGTSTCEDCVVAFLCEGPSDCAVVVDLEEYRALRVLGEAGLIPLLRHSDGSPVS